MTKKQIIVFKNTKKFNDSDEYGYKEMFRDIIENFTCPECHKKGGDTLGFFVWEDESKGIAVCQSCGVKKDFSLNYQQESKVKSNE